MRCFLCLSNESKNCLQYGIKWKTFPSKMHHRKLVPDRGEQHSSRQSVGRPAPRPGVHSDHLRVPARDNRDEDGGAGAAAQEAHRRRPEVDPHILSLHGSLGRHNNHRREHD